MDRRFASVEADVATLKLGFETLTAEVVSLQTDMDTLKTDMDTVKADIDTVKADIATLTTVTDVLALKVASIETTTADTNKRVRVRGFEE